MSSDSSTVLIYLAVFLYWVLWVGTGVAEAAWLQRKGWATWARSLIFSWLSNLLGLGVACLLLFVWALVSLALTWGDSKERLPFKGNEVGGLLVLVVLLALILLALIKRVLLRLLKMRQGGRAWSFAFFSSLIFWLLAIGLSIPVSWFLWRRLGNFSLN